MEDVGCGFYIAVWEAEWNFERQTCLARDAMYFTVIKATCGLGRDNVRQLERNYVYVVT